MSLQRHAGPLRQIALALKEPFRVGDEDYAHYHAGTDGRRHYVVRVHPSAPNRIALECPGGERFARIEAERLNNTVRDQIKDRLRKAGLPERDWPEYRRPR